MGFQAGSGTEDVVQISGLSSFADVLARARQEGGDTVIQLDGDSALTLANVSLASLSSDDFRFG